MSDERMTQRATSFRFCTDDVPAFRRPDAIFDLRDRGILPIEPLAGRDVHIDIVKWAGPGVQILFGTLAGVRQERPSGQTVGEVLLAIGPLGTMTVLHRGSELTIRQGDAFVVAANRSQFAVVRPRRTQFVGIRVPEDVLATRVVEVEAGLKPIPRGTSTKLLTSYVRTFLGRDAAHVPGTLFALHVLDLVALTVGPTRDAVESAEHLTLPAVRLQVIKSDILAHLGDDRLDVPTLANRHRITPRYVHRLFEREGLTYSHFVLRQRLDRAHRLLTDPRSAHQTISTIAYAVGFGDLSYFNRAFRRVYQQTPRDVRLAAVERSALSMSGDL